MFRPSAEENSRLTGIVAIPSKSRPSMFILCPESVDGPLVPLDIFSFKRLGNDDKRLVGEDEWLTNAVGEEESLVKEVARDGGSLADGFPM